MKRKSDIWQEFRSRVLSAAGSKSKSTFLTRYTEYYSIGNYDLKLLDLLDIFDNHEFLYVLRDNIDDLILRMRLQRERKNENYQKIKELNQQIDKNLEFLNSLEKQGMFTDEAKINEYKSIVDKQYEELKVLENAKSGFVFDFSKKQKGSKLSYTKDFHAIPYFTGNSIAGVLRRLAMRDFFDKTGIEQTYDFAYHTLFTGGVLKLETKDKVIAHYLERTRTITDVAKEKIKVNAKEMTKSISQNSGEVDIDKVDELTATCPPLRLFGSAIGNMMIGSEMQVSNAELICLENNNGESSMWGLIEDVFYTRHDSGKGERDIEIIETSGDIHQMKYIMETVIKGAEFEHEFICKSNNSLVQGAFYNALDLFCKFHVIGGKSSRGLGQLDLSELQSQINYDLVQLYNDHLEANREQIREFFNVVEAA